MEKSEFIYNFTNIFLFEAVKETVLVENWQEADLDPRYEEYSKFFLEMKNNYLSGRFSDQEITNTITKVKDALVMKFRRKYSDVFIKQLVKHGCTENIAKHLLSKDIFVVNQINANALKIFREQEEQIAK